MVMDRKTYRWCSVPQCTNTSITAPNKIFIDVPRKADIRKKFLNLAGRNSEGMSVTSPIYFCEDHFDLPNDMENYMRYRVMGFVNKIMLKPGCLPSKFDCQTDRKRRFPSTSKSHPVAQIKSQRLAVKQEPQDENTLESGTEQEALWPLNSQSEAMGVEQCTTQDNSFQVIVKSEDYLSEQKEMYFKSVTKTISPEKSSSTTTVSNINTILLDRFDNDISSSTSSVQAPLPQYKLPSDTNSLNKSHKKTQKEEEGKERKAKEALEDICKRIVANPITYIGINNKCYFLVNVLQRNTNIPTQHILLCLKKLRMNITFYELADQFGISALKAGKLFQKYIPIISKFLKPFILKINNNRNINEVSCIVESFEIEIEKPSKSSKFSPNLTWSENKKVNTIKYLIASTPNGLINYISPGYGGGITNKQLLENCDFMELLKPGSCVLATKGFKDIEQILIRNKLKLFRTPNAGPDERITREDTLKINQIVSLRSKIKVLIRRVQKFSMLKPHSVVNSKLMCVIDECVTIVCALINLQDSIVQ